MDNQYRYDAFISYRHLEPDKPVAVRLQELMESYVPPKGVSPQGKGRKLRLFRDETELPTSSDLSSGIREALESSRFLIVICSKETEKSQWCMEEITYFKSLHNGSNKNILTLLADDEGNVVFPETLQYEISQAVDVSGKPVRIRRKIEPLAANVSAPTLQQMLKRLNTEFLRLAAPILGCRYDDLYQREQRRKKKRRRWILSVTAAILTVALLTGVAVYRTIARQKREIWENNAALAVKESGQLEADGEFYRSRAAVIRAFPDEGSGYPLANEAIEQAAHLAGMFSDRLFTQTSYIALSDEVSDYVLLDNGAKLATVTADKLCLWDTESGDCVKEIEHKGLGNVFCYSEPRLKDLSFEYYAKGTISGQEIGGTSWYQDMFRRDPDGKEKPAADNALYYIEKPETAKSVLHKIDPKDGSFLWAYELPVRYEILPLEQSDHLIINTFDGLVILDTQTGKEIASGELTEELSKSYKFGVYNGSILILCDMQVNEDTYLAAFENQNGTLKLKYREKVPMHPLMLKGAAAMDEGTLYLEEGYTDGIFMLPVTQAYDIATGQLKWSAEHHYVYSGDAFIARLTRDPDDKTDDVIAACIGSRLQLMDAATGAVYEEIVLPDNAVNLCYSQEGDLLVSDSSSYELGIVADDSWDTSEETTKFILYRFGGEYGSIRYAGGTYAAVREHGNEVALFRELRNEDCRTVLQLPDGQSLDDVIFSPSGKYAAVGAVNGDQLQIVDTANGGQVCVISCGDNNLVSFLSDELVLIRSDVVGVYRTSDGSAVRELDAEKYDLRSLAVSEEQGSFCLTDIDRNLLLFRGEEEPEIAVAGVYQAELTEQVEEVIPSPSMERFLARIKVTDAEMKVDDSCRIYTAGGGFVELQTDDPVFFVKIDSCVWQEEENRIYILDNQNRILVYDDKTGKKLYETAYDGPADLIGINGELCLLDNMGKLMQITVDENGVTVGKEALLGISRPAKGLMSYERLSDGSRGILRYRDTGWLFDFEKFEIIYRIDDYCGIDANAENVYLERYDQLMSCRLPSARDVLKKVQSMQ